MKKIFLAIIAAVTVLSFVACNEGTTVVWQTSSTYAGEDLSEIKWIKGAGTDIDQEWSESLSGANDKTSRLGVEALAGHADCLVGGSTGQLTIEESLSNGILEASLDSATLKEDTEVTIVIGSAAAKK